MKKEHYFSMRYGRNRFELFARNYGLFFLIALMTGAGQKFPVLMFAHLFPSFFYYRTQKLTSLLYCAIIKKVAFDKPPPVVYAWFIPIL